MIIHFCAKMQYNVARHCTSNTNMQYVWFQCCSYLSRMKHNSFRDGRHLEEHILSLIVIMRVAIVVVECTGNGTIQIVSLVYMGRTLV